MRVVTSLLICAALFVSNATASDFPWPWHWATTTRTTTPRPSPSSEFERGVAAALGFDDISACYNKSRTGLDDLWEAVKEFDHAGYVTKTKALATFAAGITSILRALEPCSQTMTHAPKYEELIKELMDPRFYTVHNALTLALNVAEDRHQLSSSFDAFHKGDYNAAGFQITETVLDVLVNPGIPSSNGTEAVQIGLGVAEGFDADVPLKCMSDLRVEVPALVGGIIDIARGKNGTIGFQSLFHAMQGLVPCYKHCLADSHKIAALLHELEDMRHPAELAKKVMENVKKSGIDLSIFTAEAILAYKGGEWKRFGLEIGKMLGKVVLLPTAQIVV